MRLIALPLCEELAASPSNCATDGSGGLDGSACELRVALLGVADCDFCCLLFDGDNIVTMVVYVVVVRGVVVLLWRVGFVDSDSEGGLRNTETEWPGKRVAKKELGASKRVKCLH